MKTGNTADGFAALVDDSMPQWSPVMKTGNTTAQSALNAVMEMPQWSPVMKTGNTRAADGPDPDTYTASMEPGHEDREYASMVPRYPWIIEASMEPGHEDREYRKGRNGRRHHDHASMEPGHEDREYFLWMILFSLGFVPQWSPVMKTGNTSTMLPVGMCSLSLNGARS